MSCCVLAFVCCLILTGGDGAQRNVYRFESPLMYSVGGRRASRSIDLSRCGRCVGIRRIAFDAALAVFAMRLAYFAQNPYVE